MATAKELLVEVLREEGYGVLAACEHADETIREVGRELLARPIVVRHTRTRTITFGRRIASFEPPVTFTPGEG